MTDEDELRSSVAHVFVADLDQPVLETDDVHHLSRVLRVRPGEPVTVSDGAGHWRPCVWKGVAVEPSGPVRHAHTLTPAVTIGFAPVKGDRPEWVVQKLTELGVDRVVILRTERSVVRWDGDRVKHHLERLRRIAREASGQSRRCHLPEIDGVLAPAQLGGALAHFDGEPLRLASPVVMVGPEGGWSDAELRLERPHVSLGPTVLRSETAAVAAGVLLTAARR